MLGEADGTSRIPKLDDDDDTPTLRSAAATMLRLVHQSYHKATLCEKIIETRHLECADVRDKVFALLGMPHNSGEEHIRPDYDENLSQLAATVLGEHHRAHLPVLKEEVDQQCRELAEALRIDTKDLYAGDRKSAALMSLPGLAYSRSLELTLRSHGPIDPRQSASSQCLSTAALEHSFVAKLWSASQIWQVLERRLELAIRDGDVLAFKITFDALANKYPDESWVRRWHPCPSLRHDEKVSEKLAVMLYHMQLLEESKNAATSDLFLTASEWNHFPSEVSAGGRFSRLLLISALWGKVRTVRVVLEEQLSHAGCKDEFGRSPLALALMHDHSEVVEFLIKDSKCDANNIIDSLQSPTRLPSSIGNALHAAIGLDKRSCTKALLKSNAVDVNAKNQSGDAPIHLIAKSDDPRDYLQVLLLRTEVNVNIKDCAGETPLHLMCKRKTMSSSAELLLMVAGVDINATNKSGATVLHHLLCRASFDDSSENLGIISQLVGLILAKHELNVYVQDKYGHTPLMSWIVHSYERRQRNRRPVCNLNIIPRLLGNGFPDTTITIPAVSIYRLPLLYALVLSFDEAAVVEHIHDVIRQSIDCLTEVDDHGNTVLHLVESPAVIKQILQWSRAPVDVRNNAGNLPLHLLMKRYSPEIASWFRPSVVHHTEILRAYIQSGRVDVNACDTDGTTLFHLVRDESSLVELLKSPEYNIRAKNDLGMTPLRYKLNELGYWSAARWYLGPVITLLLENERIDCGSIDVQGNTMLHVWAKHWSHYDFWSFEAKLFDLLKAFVRRGEIDVNAKNKSGHTALALLDLITVDKVSYQRHLKLRRGELLELKLEVDSR